MISPDLCFSSPSVFSFCHFGKRTLTFACKWILPIEKAISASPADEKVMPSPFKPGSSTVT
jgi:hypothetical protein